MKLQFSKMHGLGNDFMVIDLVGQSLDALRQRSFTSVFTPERIRQLADRHFGIGFDQLLVVQPPQSPDNDFRYRIFNADGGEVGQCGNGARCFARFVVDRGLFIGDTVKVETASGDIVLQLCEGDMVRVNMGAPRLQPAEVPFVPEGEPSARGSWFIANPEHENSFVEVFVVSMGNPHAVMLVESVDTAPVATLGPWLESHPQFPERANIGFMQVQSRDAICLRVYERGAGETLACGTGACAAVVAGVQMGLLENNVSVQLPGGVLQIEYAGGNAPVWMTGPAMTVFHGEIDIDDA